MDAAKASRSIDQSFDPNIKSFYMHQRGSSQDQRLPKYDRLHDAGPFFTSGGGKKLENGEKEVPAGTNLYIDYYNRQKR